MASRQYLLVPRSPRELELVLRTVQQHGLVNLMSPVQRSNLHLLIKGEAELHEGFVVPIHLRPHDDREKHLEYVRRWLGAYCSRIERVGPACQFD